jgi:hypothetical protein
MPMVSTYSMNNEFSNFNQKLIVNTNFSQCGASPTPDAVRVAPPVLRNVGSASSVLAECNVFGKLHRNTFKIKSITF